MTYKFIKYQDIWICRELQGKLEAYEGVYIRYLRGGKIEKSHFGISSKLQCPMLFMKSMQVIYPAKDAMEAVLVNTVVYRGIAKSVKYAICSANG